MSRLWRVVEPLVVLAFLFLVGWKLAEWVFG